jgi:hypothetical protein
MKSFICGLVERISSSVKAPAAAVAAAPVTLGRWGIQYDERVIDRKIIQANEDHCGYCVAVPKKESEVAKQNSAVRYEKTEEYLVPYLM